jgi:hypothetical protein
LAKLSKLHDRRTTLLRDLLTPWSAFKGVEMEIQRAIQSVKWIGTEGSPSAERALAAAEEDGEAFASVTALLATGSVAPVLSHLSEGISSVKETPGGTLLALRLSADAALLEQLEAAPAVGVNTRISILAGLADRGGLAADKLVALLDDSVDEIANRAAELLAWIGRSPADAGEIDLRLHHGVPDGRRGAFLFAAVALGSATALHELRRMLDTSVPVTPPAVDALAVAGNDTDADRLLRLATRQPGLAPLAVLAAGHLGNPAAAEAIFRADVEKPLKIRSVRTIRGDNLTKVAQQGRLLHGAPWTLAGIVDRLDAQDELVHSRPWYALEATVRSGIRPSAFLDPCARVDLQDDAVGIIRRAIAQRRLPEEGSWYYWGRPHG